jgi:putative membrane protein
MPSERRLHAASILFGLVSQIREFAFPLVIAFVAGSRGDNLQAMAVPFLLLYSAVAVGRYYSYRYALEPQELVIRSGLISRTVRHIPYARIQNVDARQNLLHRALGVVEVQIETGSGAESDARMSVVAWPAYLEVRERVFGSAAPPAESSDAGPAATAPQPQRLLDLPAGELVRHGVIESRGGLVVAGLLGLLYEAGLVERVAGRFSDDDAGARSVFEAVAAFGGGGLASRILMAAGAIVGLMVVLRLLSIGLSLVRLHGFALVRTGDELRAQYGLFTRVSSTIPLRRIQTVTVRETWLHRRFGRLSVRVDTAGGHAREAGQARSEPLAPIIGRDRWPALAAAILPGLDLDAVAWQPAAPGALARAIRVRVLLAAAGAMLAASVAGWGALLVFAILAAWGVLTARWSIARLGWAVEGDAVLFRSGWWTRQMSVAPIPKIQSVSWHETAFDRRWGMARVHVDTAGAHALSHRLHIPYLRQDQAATMRAELAAAAGRTAFRW